MLRAQDKLREAGFFWNKFLEALKKSQTEYRYYFSAFITSARSIGYVLQKDLRGEYGEKFQNWWDAKKVELKTEGVDISTINKYRNITLKEGNKLPKEVYNIVFDSGPFEKIRIVADKSLGNDHIEAKGFVPRRMPVHIPDMENETEESKMERIEQTVKDAVKSSFISFIKDFKDFEISDVEYIGISLLEDDNPDDSRDLFSFCDQMKKYLTKINEILVEAQEMFPLPEKKWFFSGLKAIE